MELSCITVPRCDKAGTGAEGTAARQGPVLGSQMQLLGARAQFLWIMRTPQEL